MLFQMLCLHISYLLLTKNFLQQPTAAEAEVPEAEVPVCDDEGDKIYYVNDADVDQFSLV